MKRTILALLVLAACSAISTQARAGEFSMSIGRDVAAIDFTGARAVTNLGTRVGYKLDRVNVFATGDYARYSSRTEYDTRDFSDTGSSGRILTVGLGGRYFFRDLKADRAVPYVVATGFTVLPNSDIEESVPQAVTDSTAFGFLGGFGIDYFVGDAFSIGGEIGTSGLFASYSDAVSTWRGSILQVYSGFQLTFYL